MKELLDDEFERAYKHGMKSAISEKDMKKAMPEDSMQISFTQEDREAINQLKRSGTLEDAYNRMTKEMLETFNETLQDAILEGVTVEEATRSLAQKVGLRVAEMSRIARTEMINATNEGRISAYEQRAKIRGKENRYTLVVAGGARTCDAHRELASRIPASGLPLQELKDLQMQIGASHGMTLSGNVLLHPNQRTVIMRIP